MFLLTLLGLSTTRSGQRFLAWKVTGRLLHSTALNTKVDLGGATVAVAVTA
jgi:hypothetical protein